MMVRSDSAPAWVTVWVRVMLPAVMVMVPVRLEVEVLGATEQENLWLPLWVVFSLLVIQEALSLQFQLVLEETMKIPFPPVAGILRVG